ncbi:MULTISPECIES: phage tail assembly protein [Helicobacter]|uniref:Phage tail assembly protein n=1 Tax=Helicobacter apodemus TaxID=135569 RepID=A0A4U8UC82_9HELI|nr:phage tail assembly protein [Helicobacter apodemus]TLE14462.1 phage tail assembly protein [Helicobacter apodemus]
MEKIIKLGNKEVKMRKPLVRDVRAICDIANDFEREIAMIANLTGISIDEIDNLELGDLAILQGALKELITKK